jgi:hypothetical protein
LQQGRKVYFEREEENLEKLESKRSKVEEEKGERKDREFQQGRKVYFEKEKKDQDKERKPLYHRHRGEEAREHHVVAKRKGEEHRPSQTKDKLRASDREKRHAHWGRDKDTIGKIQD